MGYSEAELADLRATIEAAAPDVVIAGTPCDLERALGTGIPVVRARYEYEEVESPGLGDRVVEFLDRRAVKPCDSRSHGRR